MTTGCSLNEAKGSEAESWFGLLGVGTALANQATSLLKVVEASRPKPQGRREMSPVRVTEAIHQADSAMDELSRSTFQSNDQDIERPE
jgi:hypothetical protein